ncbi:aminopeptidase N-like [Schistocerca americana]|uniref:aminopeptidase N-like n=1 Tax=Schistocerca americana TaxID=7009 RepID=UPI001F4FE790|nr:aminopeptidase N-like [Schistocerca americana]
MDGGSELGVAPKAGAGPCSGRGPRASRRCLLVTAGAAVAALVVVAVVTRHVTLQQCASAAGGSGAGAADSIPGSAAAHAHGGGAKRLVRDVRLPAALRPISYTITIVPFIWAADPVGNFTFHGSVVVLMECMEDADNVTLHSEELLIDESSVRLTQLSAVENGTGTELPVERLSFDPDRQFVVFHVGGGQRLRRDSRYQLGLNYTGKLGDALHGFYRSSYKEGNVTKWIATTQFQPTDARRAFPCFDEPALKATFSIRLARPANATSISNMPRVGQPTSVAELAGHEWDRFETSVPMSTYLVAFVVSELGREADAQSRFAVWARPDALRQARYSLQLGPKLLSFYESYFDISYPLPKVDMVALPDFAAGAMENWGLITYRETAMLYEPGVSTNSNKQSVATVVAHELAHQWFGNLVTPSWWSDLWLNEGFASYIEYLGVDAVEPTWRVLEQMVTADLQNVMSLDALESSHQISIEVGHPDEINEIFDRISYGKGASIIRMMDHFLGTEVFRKGLTRYLNKWKYQSSTQNDLWAALTEQAHESGSLPRDMTVRQVMDTWTLQTGFPVVTVTRDYVTGGATLTQERFLVNSTGASGNGSLWWVPITYTDAERRDFGATRPRTWMRAQPTLHLDSLGAANDSWVVFNVEETGFYRVNYDETNWRLVLAALSDAGSVETLSAVSRAQLLDDALSLARAGRLPYATALDLTTYLRHETDYLPWKAAFNAFSYLDGALIRSADYDVFRSYILKLITKLYEHTGFTDNPTDPQLTVYKRVNVLGWACNLGHQDCVRNALLLFQNWRATPDPDTNNPISGNLKNVVYCTAIRTGGVEEWEFAWERYQSTNVGSERDILLGAMGCSREPWLLNRYLEKAVTEGSGIRRQDSARVFSAVSSNTVGQPLAYSFLRNHWNRIREYLGSSLFTLSSIVRSTTRKINTQFELDDLLKFGAEHRHELGSATRTLEQAIEQARINVQWAQTRRDEVVAWLRMQHNMADS